MLGGIGLAKVLGTFTDTFAIHYARIVMGPHSGKDYS